ncbi:hypothetical protein HMPREF1494_0218 [Bifidobacterium sp. MSTE12]|nr:hypothetical protein HMPREF1494_0218 [Bifidobacterium sp. MSTE12]
MSLPRQVCLACNVVGKSIGLSIWNINDESDKTMPMHKFHHPA